VVNMKNESKESPAKRIKSISLVFTNTMHRVNFGHRFVHNSYTHTSNTQVELQSDRPWPICVGPAHFVCIFLIY